MTAIPQEPPEQWDESDGETIIGECDWCGEMRPIQKRSDPYLREVYQECEVRWYCYSCWAERRSQV